MGFGGLLREVKLGRDELGSRSDGACIRMKGEFSFWANPIALRLKSYSSSNRAPFLAHWTRTNDSISKCNAT